MPAGMGGDSQEAGDVEYEGEGVSGRDAYDDVMGPNITVGSTSSLTGG